jgi:uncharacterized membrane protein
VIRIDGEVTIHRPVEDVFDFVADERNEPTYNPRMRSVEQLTDGPPSVGSRYRAVLNGLGKPLEMLIEFTEFDRPYRLASRTAMARMKTEGHLDFTPVDGGTRLRWHWRVSTKGVPRFATPVVAAIGRHQERQNWANLKRYLEHASTRTGADR